MITVATTIPGVFLIKSSKQGDERGYLQRIFCEESFQAEGLNTRWVQSSITSSPILGTLRGMHLQKPPFGEIKLIRAFTGKVWDCLADVRPDSPTFGKWQSFELSEENGHALYVPAGMAHGFLTLTADVRMHYSMSATYSPSHASGIRWDDPSLAIEWPGEPMVISDNDSNWPTLSEL